MCKAFILQDWRELNGLNGLNTCLERQLGFKIRHCTYRSVGVTAETKPNKPLYGREKLNLGIMKHIMETEGKFLGRRENSDELSGRKTTYF